MNNLNASDIIETYALKDNTKDLLIEKLNKLTTLKKQALESIVLYDEAISKTEKALALDGSNKSLQDKVEERLKQLKNIGLTHKAIIAVLCVEFNSSKSKDKQLKINTKQKSFNQSKLPQKEIIETILNSIDLCGTTGIRFEDLKNINPICNLQKSDIINVLNYFIANGIVQTAGEARGMRYIKIPETRS